MSNADELLRIEGIRKTFPGVVALDSVDFDLRRGEVHVLLGENGAGKSTLIKMLSGAYRPDAGRILAGGEEVRIHGAQDSERLGIATIYQEFNLVPDLTVAENIFLGRQPRRLGVIDRKRMEAEAAVLLERVGVNVSPRARVRELGIARLQMVEIAKALSLDARVLIMDEPTAVLTSEEVDRLFAIVRRLREDGVGIVFITHHLEEIAALGDRVTVIRDGRSVGQAPASTPQDELVRLMVGRSIEQQYPRERAEPGAPCWPSRGSPATACSTTSPSRCAPVRSSASPGSSAPAVPRSYGPSSGPTPTTAGPCGSRGRRSPGTTSTRRWRPGSAWCPRTARARDSCWTSRSRKTSGS